MRRLIPHRPFQRARLALDLPHDRPRPFNLVPRPLELNLVVVGLKEGKVAPVTLVLLPDGHRQPEKEGDDDQRDEREDLAPVGKEFESGAEVVGAKGSPRGGEMVGSRRGRSGCQVRGRRSGRSQLWMPSELLGGGSSAACNVALFI